MKRWSTGTGTSACSVAGADRVRVPAASRRADEGAAAVEFALVMPLLVLFLFGIMQFGLFFYRYQGIQTLAHAGARGGSVGLTVQQIADRIEDAMAIPADYTDLQIQVVLRDESVTPAVEVMRIDAKTGDDSISATGGFLVIAPCEGVANPRDFTLRVEVNLDDTIDDYKVIIPLWGTMTSDYSAVGTFSCEAAA